MVPALSMRLLRWWLHLLWLRWRLPSLSLQLASLQLAVLLFPQLTVQLPEAALPGLVACRRHCGWRPWVTR